MSLISMKDKKCMCKAQEMQLEGSIGVKRFVYGLQTSIL